MALPSSGPISMGQIRTELEYAVSPISLNDPDVRDLAEVPSGPISLNDFYGKSAIWKSTLTCGTATRKVVRRYYSTTTFWGTWVTNTTNPNEADLSGYSGPTR